MRARTLAYDSSPRARASARSGSVPRARATRTRSRAAPRSSPTRQESQAAQERKPVFHPPAGVELADQGEQARGGGVEVRGQLGDLVAEPVELATAGCVGTSTAGEWICMASPPSAGATLHPGFRAAGERPGRAISSRGMIFVPGPLNRPRVCLGGHWAGTGQGLAAQDKFTSRRLSSGKARDELQDGGHAPNVVRLVATTRRTMTPPVLRRTAWLRGDAPTTHPGSCREPAGPS